MSATPPEPSGPGPDGPAAARYPNTARIWNYQLGGDDNFPVDRAASEAATALFRMTQDLHWNTPLISRGRASIARFFDGLTLVEPGLVRPAQWRAELDNPLRWPRADGDDKPVLRRRPVPGPSRDNSEAAWHLCGVGVRA
jgi:hypothetical protein